MDIQELQLLLGAETHFGKSQDQDTQVDLSRMTQTSARMDNIDLRLLPNLKYQCLSLEQELQVNIPFENYVQHSNYAAKYIGYSRNDNSNDQYDSEFTSIQLSFSPELNYTRHLNFGFVSNDLTILGSMKFERSIHTSSNLLNPGSTSRQESKNENYQLQIHELIRTGVGRIFEGKYAYQGMQIAAELARALKWLKPMTTEDMQDLGKLLAILRTEYTFDRREKMLSDMHWLGGFLSERGYIEKDDFDALLLVQDIYQNVSQDPREFGSQANVRLGADFELANSEQISFVPGVGEPSFFKEEPIALLWYVGAEWQYREPLDRVWQWDVSATCDYYPAYVPQINSDEYQAVPLLRPGLETRLACYFDTRFSIALSNAMQLRWPLGSRRRIEEQSWGILVSDERDARFDETLQAAFKYQLSGSLSLTAAVSWSYSLDRRISGTYQTCPNDATQTLTAPQITYLLDRAGSVEDYTWRTTVSLQYEIF
ncbi:MAG: hypothetical protein AB1439_10000 [candidate division FCPU426 bacterium]